MAPDSEGCRAFKAIKAMCRTAIQISCMDEAAAIDGSRPMEQVADACGYAWGATLLQMDETLTGFRLDEIERINDISKMHLSGLERSVINSGHYYAMISSDAQISQYGSINEQTNGISYIKNIKNLKLSNGDINIDKLVIEFEDYYFSAVVISYC